MRTALCAPLLGPVLVFQGEALPRFSADLWPNALPMLRQGVANSSADSSGFDMWEYPSRFVVPWDGSLLTFSLHRLHEGPKPTVWEQIQNVAVDHCERLRQPTQCHQSLAAAAELTWIRWRRHRWRASLALRGIELTHLLFLNLGFDNFERHLISRGALQTDLLSGPPLRVLELGSFEGGSTIWLAERLLQQPDAHVLCIDAWTGLTQQLFSKRPPPSETVLNELAAYHEVLTSGLAAARFEANVARTPCGDRVRAIRSTTVAVLGALLAHVAEAEADVFDFVYVDAGHSSSDVLTDAVLAFRA
eukprot:gnl/TRDRNA2_/TRDRNA2_161942_c0_seq1.p1 gnl/TRDRNA2_/TRDRNA2_161942_c0~~gnl/TRDRNA2_/TRDRNA2_161942_c0_seq1.p1  ORF type:complete len:304 (-),score=39.82 gnl/TRDRNA2_/TRDRNA2_161942_c0_seq1:35-946(-)